MSYAVRFTEPSVGYLDRLDARTQERILARISQIAEDPFGRLTWHLNDPRGRRAARVGAWRIVFSVDAAAQVVLIGDIGPRGQIYRRL